MTLKQRREEGRVVLLPVSRALFKQNSGEADDQSCKRNQTDDNRPLRVAVEAEDHLGRKLRAEGVRKAVLNWYSYSFIYCSTSQFEWKWDGHVECGESNEFMNQRQRRKLVQAAKNKAGVFEANKKVA